MPYCVLLMLQLRTVLLLLPLPALVMLMVLLPEPMPMSVCVLPLPTAFTFSMTLLVAPSVPLLSNQTTAEDVPVFVLVMVRSRDPATVGASSEAAFEPSNVTKSAPLRKMIALALEPLMEGVTPIAGLMVTVLVALEPPLALMVSGKV